MGTWSSSVDSVFPEPLPAPTDPSPAASPRGEGAPQLRVHRGGAVRAPSPVPVRAADAAPLPAGALAIAPLTASLPADETAPRRRLVSDARPAEVVRLLPLVSAPDLDGSPPTAGVVPGPPVAREQAASPTTPERPASGERALPVAPRALPPFLATALLREDLSPPEPARESVRTLALAVGVTGALLAGVLGGLSPLTVLVVLVFVGMAVAAVAPLGFESRAGTLAGLSLLGIGISDWPRLVAGTGPEELLLSIGMLLLASFLLLRSYHRASRLARGGVAIALAAMVLWLVVTSSATGLTLSPESWRAWADAGFRVALVMFLFLSLLAFLGSGSRGGCHLWAYGLVALYGLHAMVHEVDLLGSGAPGDALPNPTAAALVLGVASLGIGALALAQLYAAARLRGLRALVAPPV